jgi:8-oxo-dGTP diphosphatase
MQPIKVVAGIIWNEGRYLAVQRPKGKRMAGWWEFPGGKAEAGEPLEQALVRELREELSITAISFSLWQEKTHRYPDFSVQLFFYWVAVFQGWPTSLEGQVMAWVVPDRNRLAFLEADRDIVKKLALVQAPTS